MKNLKNICVFALLVGFLFLLPIAVIAQVDPPNPCPDPSFPGCPIDSNLYILFGIAIFFAAKKGYDHKKATSTI